MQDDRIELLSRKVGVTMRGDFPSQVGPDYAREFFQMRFVQKVVGSGFKCLGANIRIARNHYDGNFDTVHPQHSD